MGYYIRIENYRGIRAVDFKPDGVCLLVGPNGSGKSTLLSALEFLKNIFERGFEKALNFSGGAYGFNHFDSAPDRVALFDIETAAINWEIEIDARMGGDIFESVIKNGKELPRIPSEKLEPIGAAEDDLTKMPFRIKKLYDNPNKGEDYESLAEFVKRLSGYRNYFDYHLWLLRNSGSQESSDTVLDHGGQNAFSVLRNWLSSKPLRERYEFVKETLQEAFHPFFDDFDFEVAGRTVSMRIFPPDSTKHIPVFFAPNGFLTGLLHLMAVCSTPDGGIVGIDEPENGLHPHAIQTILEAIRDRAVERDLTVLLATHSPFLLNQYREESHRVFVMDPNEEKQLTALDELRDPEWLRFFSLGDLYGRDFAVQEYEGVENETT